MLDRIHLGLDAHASCLTEAPKLRLQRLLDSATSELGQTWRASSHTIPVSTLEEGAGSAEYGAEDLGPRNSWSRS